jgi:glutamine synthetase
LVRYSGLPRSLNEALQALTEDGTVCAALGEHIARRYLEAKGEEWERFMAEVHQWELDEYLAKY